MKNILITGGAGYIGSILSEHLLAGGYNVTILDNLMHGEQSLFHLVRYKNFQFHHGDVRDRNLVNKLVKNADVIIPLAALVGAPICQQLPDLAYEINYDSIRHINDIRSRNQLILYPNTNSGYGTKTKVEFCTENTPLEPISQYGITKTDAEKILLQDENAISFRLATVFGASPRMRTDLLVNDFTYQAFSNKTLVLFEKEFRRNFIHVRDVADCFMFAIQNFKKLRGAYNLGLDDANLSKELLAYKVKDHVPDLYIHFAPIGSDPDKRDYIVSNQKLKLAGFAASRSLDDGIRELLVAYRLFGKSKFKNI